MDWLKEIAKIVLECSHEVVILPLVIIGYIWLNRTVFFHAICLILLSMLINPALKATFRIPLSPTLHKEGFAFPSGHMQLSTILYGWISQSSNSIILKSLLVALLLCIGASLIYMQYHDVYDVLGAVFFALMIISGYSIFIKYVKNELFFVILLLIATSCMIYTYCVYKLAPFMWMAYFTLWGFLLSEYLVGRKIVLYTKKEKCLATVLCFAVISLWYVLFELSWSGAFPMLAQFKWFLVGFFIPFSSFLVGYLGQKTLFKRG